MTGAADIQTVAILGFGTMGTGIAQVCAAAGFDVVVLEASPERLATGQDRLRSFLDEGVRRDKVSPEERSEMLGRIRGVTDTAELAGGDIVIEAVVEEAALKRDLLPRVAGAVGPECVIATNTSAMSVTDLAAVVPVPQRFAGLHFFNPAPLMELVEVVTGLETTDETVATLRGFSERLGKHPVVTKDRPGFLVNRLLMPYLNQVVQDYDDEIASAEDIDAALRLGLGYPMGALELLDLIGLDNHLHATSAAYGQTHEPSLAPPPLLGRMVAAGRLGKKSGRGFYDWKGGR